MLTSYSGHVVIDGDENHRWTVTIDDLDSPHWKGSQMAGSPGAHVPTDGTTISVTLADGPRVTYQATAWFRGTYEHWLQGVSAFEPPA
jgi:hypothetical protein